ncbi:reverse transcriptase domain-containing protein [Tanacetum coccineum]|uniref:Reverse transcriptase domain-containing protein n=1 Tax=Tanacetum coccineum TaxID=301880 RepID=A0ABQ5B5F7_9ASTR
MEEMLYNFIDEGKREHEEIRAFICDFQTTNEILFKERNNSLIELRFELPSKEKDPGSFTIPYDIGQMHINNALAYLGASISLMPYTMYERLGLGEPKATRMSLELADRSIQYPRGIIKNVLIKVDKFVLSIDFVILDMPEDSRVPIILGRPFLATARAMIDVFNKKITLKVGDDEVIFDVDQSTKRPPTEDDECYRIDDLDNTINAEAQELLANDEPDSFLSRGLEKSIDQSDLEGCEPVECNTDNDSNEPIRLLEKRKGATAWKMSNIKGISPSYCTHRILMEDDFKPVIQPQRRLNSKVQDVVKNEIVKLLDSDFNCTQRSRKDNIHLSLWDFAYRRIPFGLCNAPATFQICMAAFFYDMVEDFMEVFMDEFSVFGNSFDCCLANLDRMLARYEETNLVLNREKYHFMVKEEIVLGHKISGAGIEVDRAKIDVIAKLPYPTNVKGVRSFQGYA